MKASPLLSCFAAGDYEFGACAEMTVALKSKHSVATDLYLADLSALRKFLVVGAGAAAWLGTQGFAAPDWFKRHGAQGRWVARLGNLRYLVGEGSEAPGELAITPGRLSDEVLVLAQDSVEIALGGPAAAPLLNEFCAIDLDTAVNDEWIPMQLAQIDVSVYRSAQEFRLICAPADGQFLFSILTEAVTAQSGSVLGFADYQQVTRGGGA
jgi:sarcosine oxidase gamma subunit